MVPPEVEEALAVVSELDPSADGPTCELRPNNPVLAIDPGRAKCGVAVVDETLAVLERTIVPTTSLGDVIRDFNSLYTPGRVIMGDGTGSAFVHKSVMDLDLGCPVELVEECHTSEAARARYIADVPARGLRRLLPVGLRTPETPYDDYVAVILAERWWRSRRGKGAG
jgi:RNase H-fold protein (predicted Holliday junction resolvase)